MLEVGHSLLIYIMARFQRIEGLSETDSQLLIKLSLDLTKRKQKKPKNYLLNF